MKEYLTEAVILGQDSLNDLDSRIDFYTKDFGRIKAKAKSLKKPTSKLAAHLEPLTLSRIRLVEKNGLSVADALTIDRFEILRRSPENFEAALKLLEFFRANILEGQADPPLWEWLKNALTTAQISYDSLMKRLGH